LQDSALTVKTGNPDFTDCFQKSVLVWVPAGFLWFVSLFYVPYLWHQQHVHPWCHITWL